MSDPRCLRFPESPPRRVVLGRWAVGLLFLGLGLAALGRTLAGAPIGMEGGGTLPPWLSVVIGLAFAAAGAAMLARSDCAVIDIERRRVRAWRHPSHTYPRTFPLGEFDRVSVRRYSDETGTEEIHTLWLAGPERAVFLEEIENAEEAKRRAQNAAVVLGFRVETSDHRL